jgi:hypothetical protein
VKLTTHLHLVPRSKNEWSYNSTPQYAFMVWCSVKAQGQLYLLPYQIMEIGENLMKKHIDYVKAFDMVNHHKLWTILEKEVCPFI